MAVTAIQFTKVREVTVSGFSAEADPNATPPAAASIFPVPAQVNGQGDGVVRGYAVKFTYTDDAGVYKALGTVTFTPWFKDPASGLYVGQASVAAAAGNVMQIVKGLGDVFQQVTVLSAPSGGTKVQVWVAPLSTL